MKQKSILFISHTEFKGLRWGRTFPIAKAFSNNGYKSVLITTSKKKSLKLYHTYNLDNVKVYCLNSIIPFRYLKLPLSLFTLNFLFRLFYVIFHKFDYVFSDCGEVPLSGWPCKISQKIHNSIYISEYGDLLGKGGYYDQKSTLFKALLGKYFLWSVEYFRKTADYVVVLSNVMKEYVNKEMKIPYNKIRLMPGGSLSNEIKYQPLNPTSKSIINLGYIGIDNGEIKGILPILNCIKTYYPQDFKVQLFGRKLSDNIIQKYKIQDIIVENGWVDVIQGQDIIKNVDIFLLMRENLLIGAMGWPNKLGDYMSYGRPVIIAPYGDLIEFVKKHQQGFISVDPLNQEDLKEQLRKILAAPQKLVQMGDYNRNVAESEISWDARVAKFISEIN